VGIRITFTLWAGAVRSIIHLLGSASSLIGSHRRSTILLFKGASVRMKKGLCGLELCI
jgi:hypothetical protein